MNIYGTGCPSFLNYTLTRDFSGKSGADVNQLSLFFQRYLLEKAISVFKWDIPSAWNKHYMLYTLYCWGYLAFINTNLFGVIPQGCGLQGFDVFYAPTHAVITNPLLKGILTPKIGSQCCVMKLQPDYGGIMDLVEFYGNMMAQTAQTAGVNLANSKLSYVFTAKNKAAAASFSKLYESIVQGKAANIVDEKLFNNDGSPAWQAFEQNVGQNYIADKLLNDLVKWEQRFDTAIGIPNANVEKRERLIVDEVNANNIETATLCELWLEELQKSCKEIKEMFGVDISVDWRVKPAHKEVDNSGINA